MSATLSEFLTVLLIFIGTFISFLSAVGLIRFPDVYSRAHALSKSSTIGVVLVLVGTLIFFVFQEGFFSIRLLLAIFSYPDNSCIRPCHYPLGLPDKSENDKNHCQRRFGGVF